MQQHSPVVGLHAIHQILMAIGQAPAAARTVRPYGAVGSRLAHGRRVHARAARALGALPLLLPAAVLGHAAEEAPGRLGEGRGAALFLLAAAVPLVQAQLLAVQEGAEGEVQREAEQQAGDGAGNGRADVGAA